MKQPTVSTNPENKQMNPEVETLKKWLGRGWSVKLQKETGMSRPYVSDVVNNLRTDSPIWGKVIALAEANQVLAKRNTQKLSKLLKKAG